MIWEGPDQDPWWFLVRGLYTSKPDNTREPTVTVRVKYIKSPSAGILDPL
jgi:hypothetical protein